ncbi:MAG: ThuA domain-containing protein [Acidobacteria bacterium]|nr:ThuA domain-containing protein [Acidobacteriota bacterium]
MRLRIALALGVTALAASLGGAVQSPAAAPRPLKILVITGQSDLPYHDWRVDTASIRQILDRAGIFDLRVLEEPRGISAAALAGYDALIINYNGPRWGSTAEAAVEDFVRSGRGLVAFHQACYGPFFGFRTRQGGGWDKTPEGAWAGFTGLIGASWKPENIGHAVRHVFPVKWTDPANPIAAGLPPEFMANDELYHKINLEPSAHVLADAYDDPAQGGTGRREPQIWTVPYGRGRVFITTLGHDASAWYQDGVINAFARGVEWAASGKVTLAPLDTLHRTRGADPVRVLLVTSGHTYPVSIYSVFENMPGIVWEHAPTHAEAFRLPLENRFDVVVLHDMFNEISPQAQSRLQAFVESGKGLIELHHSIVDYTSWPWWYEEVIGGKYFEKAQGTHGASAYREDVEFLVTPAKGKDRHPVLRGVGPLWVYDEMYRGMWHSSKIEVLMETENPANDRPVVYVGPHPKARVLYIQLGHSDHTMRHPGFQRLMQNAVMWTARRP